RRRGGEDALVLVVLFHVESRLRHRRWRQRGRHGGGPRSRVVHFRPVGSGRGCRGGGGRQGRRRGDDLLASGAAHPPPQGAGLDRQQLSTMSAAKVHSLHALVLASCSQSSRATAASATRGSAVCGTTASTGMPSRRSSSTFVCAAIPSAGTVSL